MIKNQQIDLADYEKEIRTIQPENKKEILYIFVTEQILHLMTKMQGCTGTWYLCTGRGKAIFQSRVPSYVNFVFNII